LLVTFSEIVETEKLAASLGVSLPQRKEKERKGKERKIKKHFGETLRFSKCM
jgi:hypothetical protein